MELLAGYEYDDYKNCRPSLFSHDDILLLLAAVCVKMAKLRRGESFGLLKTETWGASVKWLRK
jgi:hypothetical protein